MQRMSQGNIGLDRFAIIKAMQRPIFVPAIDEGGALSMNTSSGGDATAAAWVTASCRSMSLAATGSQVCVDVEMPHKSSQDRLVRDSPAEEPTLAEPCSPVRHFSRTAAKGRSTMHRL